MSEELNNKFRLNQARRGAVRKKLDESDRMPARRGAKGSEERERINKERKNRQRQLYGGKKEAKDFRKYLNVAKKTRNVATAFTAVQGTDFAIYGVAFSLAALKDLLDLVGIGSLPAIGTVITLCVSIAIGFVLIFDGVSISQQRVARRMARRWLVLIAGTIVEAFLFGLNFIPFEILTVAIIYWMSLVDRKAR